MEYKVSILGDAGVGKSALTIQFIGDRFTPDYDPTIEDSYRKQLVVDGLACVLNVQDTAGQDAFTALYDQHIKDSQGFILVYATESMDSLLEAGNRREKILLVKDIDEVPMVLCGNKCDLEPLRQVPTEIAKKQAELWGIPFFETSALTRMNVTEPFHQIIREIRQNYSKNQVRRKII